MALAQRKPRDEPKGSTTPRIAPPVPARSLWKEYRDLAAQLGYELYPWQEHAARYLTALGQGTRWLYREVAVIVARQNGKTTLLVPLIVQRLLDGQKIMHTAQNAKLPREVHELVATLLQAHYPNELRAKRAISYAIGHEEIRMRNGGHYRIVAPTRGGARGPSNDLVIVDELREMEDHGFIGAAKPTLTHSTKPQMVYLSNAGTEKSEVLHALQARRAEDPALAYLEWSAAPERADDDLSGWLEANPSYGYDPAVAQTLEDDYRSDRLAGTLAIFETEHLCRPVISIRAPLVDADAWQMCAVEEIEAKSPRYMGVSVDPDGQRASAVLAWRNADGTTGLRGLLEATGDPIPRDELGRDLRKLASDNRVLKAAYDPITDREIAKYLPRAEAVGGQNFVNASSTFRTAVQSNQLRHADADAVTDDLKWTTRKDHDETGSFQAVRADDDRPITAALAAVRAVWLASGLKPPQPRVL